MKKATLLMMAFGSLPVLIKILELLHIIPK